jgi:hypothetical protein
MRYSAVYVVLIVVVALGLFIGLDLYKANKNYSITKTTCKIVFDTFYDEKLKEYPDGCLIGPADLKTHLLLSETMEIKLRQAWALQGAFILDAWGNGIYVIKSGQGIRVRSDGPDGLRNTDDDYEYK